MEGLTHWVRASKLAALGWLLLMSTGMASHAGWVFVGTYTGDESRGIYSLRIDPETSQLSPARLAAESQNPSFLAAHPRLAVLYAANEIGDFEGGSTGSISAFAIDDETGRLALINSEASGGASPCHLELDRRGRCVAVANYSSGTTGVLGVQRDGSLASQIKVVQHSGSSVRSDRQSGPHAHSVAFDPFNRFLVTADLGLDKLLVFRFSSQAGAIVPPSPDPVVLPPGSGPRHFIFSRDGRFGYVINELNSTLTSYRFSAREGRLDEIDTVRTLPPDYAGKNWTAEVQVHPNGRFVYGSNRGENTIVVFSVDPKTGKLSRIQSLGTQGRTPRHFAIHPGGELAMVANQDSDSLVVLKVNRQTGMLSLAGQSVRVPRPVCVLFWR